MAHYAEKWSSAVQKQIGKAFAIVRSASVDRSRAKWRAVLGTLSLALAYGSSCSGSLRFISATHFPSCLFGLHLAGEQVQFPQCYEHFTHK